MNTARGIVAVPVAPPDAAVAAVLERRIFAPTSVGLGVVAVGFGLLDLARMEVPYALQVLPFALSVLLFGLPHGALDHLVPARLDRRISIRRSIASVVVLYLVLGGATAVLWSALPVAGFVLFIAVTWFHWGQGDLWLDSALRGTASGRADAVLTVLARGSLPMLLPLVTHRGDYVAVLQLMTHLVDPASGADAGGALLRSIPLRAAVASLLAALIAAHLLVRWLHDAPIRDGIVELAVLVALFTTVPPVLAVGLYFTFWHAVRHIVRLKLLEPHGRAALAAGNVLTPFVRFLRDALPVTVCAIALLAGLALLLHDAGLGTYLLLIAALTTPHTAVVTWMDRRGALGPRGASGRWAPRRSNPAR